ncbi:putative hydrolase or acyltransferase of alpha/beta superfamily [Thioflavicoccus mobilis 8321]|uniref:Putative hydrolase or acyltransferase of alpha/beta superfamily n=1 Tax=Thioflavicoccus mobilis 8321 TaxID=765912 RepID=L0GX80_9GAMM|nr:alpha/beta hydrolase [Thioflavicoccus mobilis]AGA89914.1 putative hydrolase or acyltransferase of alpha/beta superfamily [Thioflavicoccus mobilis 8321]
MSGLSTLVRPVLGPLLALALLFVGPLSVAAPPCEVGAAQVELAGGTLHFSRTGHGPPVVLLHGLFAQKEQWHELACALSAAGFEVLAPDLPGFGGSEGFAITDYDFARQVALLDDLADALGFVRFDLAGNSMGGAIAALYAVRHPERVGRLAFIGAPLGWVDWGPDLRQAILEGVNPFIPVDRVQLVREMRLLFVRPPALPATVGERLIEDYRVHLDHYRRVWDIVGLFGRVLADGTVDALAGTGPVLILWGEGDAIYPVAGAASLHARLPQSRLVVLPEAGHLPMLERPAETAAVLIDFLGARD